VGGSLAHNAYDVRRTFAFTALLPEAFGGGPLFGGVNREATSTPDGTATDLWGDWAFPVRLGAWSIRPSAGLRYARYATRAWTETGADALSLSAPDQAIHSAQGDLGLRAGRSTGRFRPNASATYRRELTNGTTPTTLLLSDRAGLFLINGLPLTREALTTRAGLTFQTEHTDLSFEYELRRAPNQTRQAIQFGMGF
jgi:outer membrane autotransporter protein